ncbi:hypothetical protein RAM19_05825 [Bartonella apihabitans]|nr:hypothetical protein [Bartonella apihabitans]WLT09648.1 hypothetical protein RAM19_05825 [Bartonella apihabitans]
MPVSSETRFKPTIVEPKESEDAAMALMPAVTLKAPIPTPESAALTPVSKKDVRLCALSFILSKVWLRFLTESGCLIFLKDS